MSYPFCSESVGISSRSADILGGESCAVDVAEVGGVREGFAAGSSLGVQFSWGPCAASPGHWSTIDTIDMWEHISVGDGSGWPSVKVDSSGGGNKSEEFHF